MNQSRLEQLLNFLKEDPEDPFNLYAVATEYKLLDPRKAKEYFDKLLKYHEEYVATYYHAARLYSDLGDRKKSEDIFKKGMEIAMKINDHHAFRELQSAYNEFLFDEEE